LAIPLNLPAGRGGTPPTFLWPEQWHLSKAGSLDKAGVTFIYPAPQDWIEWEMGATGSSRPASGPR